MRTILFFIAAFLIGALVAVIGYRAVIPWPTDAVARGEAFQPENRDWFFQNASEVYPTRTVARSEMAQPFEIDLDALDGFTYEYDGQTRTLENLYSDMETSGLVILHDGTLVHESYGRGARSGTQFTTFSLVKSFTSTLVGFAVHEGLIETVDDPLTNYLSDLAGTAYEGVTIKQALQMSSGVAFDKEGEGIGQDTVDFITDSAVLGKRSAYEIAKSYPRAADPGTDFNYNTAETQILLELVRKVTGKNAALYLEEKMWRPLGMEHDAGWILDKPGPQGAEIGGAFFNAALRDWARFGQLIEQDGIWNGEALLPPNWVLNATTSDEPHLMPGALLDGWNRGYAWQWWTYPNGTFTASGANGQAVFVDQANDLVIARASAWPEGYIADYDMHFRALYEGLANWFDVRESVVVESGLSALDGEE